MRILNPSQNKKKFEGNNSSLVELSDICLNYGNIEALRNLNLSIQVSELIFLTGSTGAGKTSLLKLISGEEQPSKGRVLSKTKRIGKIFQDLRLLSDFSVEENLFLSFDKSIYKNKNSFYESLLEYSTTLGVKDILNRKVGSLNGGAKQKVAFVRALLTKPQIILADEPTSSLDFQSAKLIFEILNFLNTKTGLTVIWATHNRELIKKFTGKIMHLEKGRLVHMGHACFI